MHSRLLQRPQADWAFQEKQRVGPAPSASSPSSPSIPLTFPTPALASALTDSEQADQRKTQSACEQSDSLTGSGAGLWRNVFVDCLFSVTLESSFVPLCSGLFVLSSRRAVQTARDTELCDLVSRRLGWHPQDWCRACGLSYTRRYPLMYRFVSWR